MNSRDPSPTPEEVPEAPPAKKKSKRKRAFSRYLRKGVPDLKSSSDSAGKGALEAEQPSDVPPSDQLSSESALIRQSVCSNASSRRWSRADYQKELKVALEQISQLQSEVDTQASQLKVSESKRRKLMDAHEHAKQGIKEQKQKAKDAESEAFTSSKALTDAQHHTQSVVAEVKKAYKVCTCCLHFHYPD